MSDTAPKPAEGVANPAPQEDLVKNVKAEMDRKFGNLESTIQRQTELLSSLLQPKPAPTPDVDLEDLVITNPRRAVEVITDKVTKSVRETTAKDRTFENRRAQVQQEIYQDYPEAADPSSDLFRKANEIWTRLPEDERSANISMKAAFRDAAAELDIKPKSKRQSGSSDVDTFSLGNGSGSPPSNRKGKDELPSELTDFAKIMGVNTDDPKVVARLKEKQGRKWGSYQPIKK